MALPPSGLPLLIADNGEVGGLESLIAELGIMVENCPLTEGGDLKGIIEHAFLPCTGSLEGYPADTSIRMPAPGVWRTNNTESGLQLQDVREGTDPVYPKKHNSS